MAQPSWAPAQVCSKAIQGNGQKSAAPQWRRFDTNEREMFVESMPIGNARSGAPVMTTTSPCSSTNTG
jgi:hypothetical protein